MKTLCSFPLTPPRNVRMDEAFGGTVQGLGEANAGLTHTIGAESAKLTDEPTFLVSDLITLRLQVGSVSCC